jgi:hypothetical protein
MQAVVVAFAPWGLVLILMPLILWWHARATIGAGWEQKPSLHRPFVLEMDDQRVMTQSLNSDTIYRWNAFLRFREVENLFILATEDSTFLMVPKRYLADQAMMVEFRALLQTHIAEGYFLTVPQAAFPIVQAASMPPPPLDNR